MADWLEVLIGGLAGIGIGLVIFLIIVTRRWPHG